MIRHSKILLASLAVTLCLSALAIIPVCAVPGDDADGVSDPGQRLVNCLVLLEEQGIDVTEIQAAFESGDRNTVHLLMEELRDEGFISVGNGHDAASGGSECGRDRTGELKRKEQIEVHIEMIGEKGIDVTGIRTALELGDLDAVRALLADLCDECTPEGAENGDFGVSM